LREPFENTANSLPISGAPAHPVRPGFIKSTNPVLIIDHVTIVDPTESQPKSDASVVIVGDKIESIRPYSSRKRRADAVVVDGTGKFLIAGLWDMHVHSLSKNQPDRFFPLFVANGVTGIRDMGEI